MSFDPDYLELMPSTLTVNEVSGFNSYGEPTYSTTTTTYRCLITEKPTQVFDQMGEEVVATHHVIVASTSRLSATAEYTFPDGSTPHLASMSVFYDEDGIHHHELFFGGR